jgi:hypothetical protein
MKKMIQEIVNKMEEEIYRLKTEQRKDKLKALEEKFKNDK